MIKTLHIAAQYLAAANISYVTQEADDSHTNLGWDISSSSLLSRKLDDKECQLALNFRSYSLDWLVNSDVVSSLLLEGASHKDILLWLDTQFKSVGIVKPYNYTFHYDTGYGSLTNDYVFESPDVLESARLIELLNTAQLAIERILKETGLTSDIRVWPHHFDLGAYVIANGKLSIGLGMAIPDEMINDHYYYVSGYNSNGSLSTAGMPALSNGMWRNDGFKGATFNASGVDKMTAEQFINDAIKSFIAR